MTDPSSPEDAPSKQDQDSNAKRDGMVADNSGTDRRDLLNQLRNAAIAGPVLLTLKSAPARAFTHSATASGAAHFSHRPQDKPA